MKLNKLLIKNDCCICEEVKNGRLSSRFYNHYPIKNRICYETKNFIVVPSVSPLKIGHLLFFPKEHTTNLMKLNDIKINELKQLILKYKNLINDDLYFFEHGVRHVTQTACGINHAHLHMLPLDKGISENINDEILNNYSPTKTDNLFNLLLDKNNMKSYLIFGNNINNIFLINNEEIPSQFMRKLISKYLKNKYWDWKLLFGWDDFYKTYNITKIYA